MEIVKTDKEKLAMYMKCKKKELAEMLLNCNKHLDMQIKNYNSSDKSGIEPYCDVCKRRPITLIVTQFGTFCEEHAKYV